MKSVDLFLKNIRLHGQTAVFHKLTGTVCPCVDSETGNCNRWWHRDNPGNEECNGTGIVAVTDTATSLKAFVLPKAQVDEKTQTRVGMINNDDHLFMGAWDIAGGAIFDVSVFDKETDHIIFKGNKYELKNIDVERLADEIAYYFALMTRVAN